MNICLHFIPSSDVPSNDFTFSPTDVFGILIVLPLVATNDAFGIPIVLDTSKIDVLDGS
jgi:hypothetical protein